MRVKKVISLCLLLLIVLAIFNIKNIGKMMYPIEYKTYIKTYSIKYNLDPIFVAAVIKTESNFDAGAVSSKKAYGLMQITPETAEWASKKMKISNGYSDNLLLDPEYNIKMGCWYLKNLHDEFKNWDVVLAAYNGGRGNVRKWLKSTEHSKDGRKLTYIPFKETDKYVKKVTTKYNVYKYLYGKSLN